MNELTKYNFCSRVYSNNGVKLYDILTNGLVTIEEEDKITTDIVTLSEEMVYKVLQGRKYKIVNLKIDNDKIVLKDTSEDLDLVKNICCPIQLFDDMEQPFKDIQIKFMGKKVNYMLRKILPEYSEYISIPHREVGIWKNDGVHCFFTFIPKNQEKSKDGKVKYDFALHIAYNSYSSLELVSWKGEPIFTVAEGDISDYNTDELYNLIVNIIEGYIKSNKPIRYFY